MKRVRRVLMRWLRIPPDPHPPAGSQDSVRVFRASPRYLRYRLAGWGVRQVGVVIGLVVAIGFSQFGLSAFGWETVEITEGAGRAPGFVISLADRLRLVEHVRPDDGGPEEILLRVGPALAWAEVLGLLAFAIQLPVTFLGVLLAYDLHWYIVTDRSLRIREGVLGVREITMTFANVQNLAIEQGPAQRLFGIADLRVRSAGGGEGESDSSDEDDKESMHSAYFRGVDNAPELRELMLRRLRALEDAGLGDDVAPPATARDGSAAAAARRLLDEARALRSALG